MRVEAGGAIPEEMPESKEIAVRAVFGPGSPASEMIELLKWLEAEHTAPRASE